MSKVVKVATLGLVDGEDLGLGKQKAAREDTKQRDDALDKQKQKENLRLAEAEGEIARRKAGAKSKNQGRSLLVATSERGTSANPAQKLGG